MERVYALRIRNLFLILLALSTGGIPIITLIDIEYISTLEHMSIGFALFAWLPVGVGIFILVLYSFITNPPEYIKTRRYQYCNAILILGSVILLFEAKKIRDLVHLYNLNSMVWIITAVLSLVMCISQIVINIYLSKNHFSLLGEIHRTNQVKEIYKKLCGEIRIEKYNSLFILLGIIYMAIHVSLVGMAIIQAVLLAMTFFLKHPDFKMRKGNSLYQQQNFSIRRIVINYLTAYVLSILLYNRSHILAFMMAYASQLTTYIADNRVVRGIYSRYSDQIQ